MKQVLIVHGALGSSAEFGALKEVLSEQLEVALLNFEGHGGKPSSQPFSIDLFVQNVETYLQELNWKNPLVFGYSMGGYVALKLESQFPGTFEKIVTLGTKFDWNPESSEKEAGRLNPEKIEEKVPVFAAYLESLHGAEWKNVLLKTAKMMLELGKKPVLEDGDFHSIRIPVYLMRGSKDILVSSEETTRVQTLLTQATYHELPDWEHPINRISSKKLAEQLLNRLLPG